MADRFFNPLDIAQTSSNGSVPAGFTRVQATPDGKLRYQASGQTAVTIEPAIVSQLIIDGGNASTVPAQVALRIDFGLGN